MKILKSKKAFLVAVSIVLIVGGGVSILSHRDIPFVTRADWAIGIYTGTSPLQLKPAPGIINPVLTGSDVTDVSANFVADPFMIKTDHGWYLFFEVLARWSSKGAIGLATSDDGLHWKYDRVVLREDYHLSFPYVFKYRDSYYMIPESYHAGSIRLYKADPFPYRWRFVKDLIKGPGYVDNAILHYKNKWWLFTSNLESDELSIFYADDLLGPWSPHPGNPVIKGNANVARPGGRIILYGSKILRYVQDDDPSYGNCLRVEQVVRLSTTEYKEVPAIQHPLLTAAKSGWNESGMHHADVHRLGEHRWIACVDGYQPSPLERLFGAWIH